MMKELSKKADLSIQVIIVAVIALIVMLVLILIFTGRMSIFAQESESCENQGGTCVAKDTCTGTYDKVMSKGKCTDNTLTCCLKLVKEEAPAE